MKIDATRYSLFWSNPERYRLRELWKLSPIEPKPDTWAYKMQFGRRRGTCFHELMDAAYRGVPECEEVDSLIEAGFLDQEIAVAVEMSRVAIERDKGLEILAHETLFEVQIPDSPHSITGRIDRILRDEKGVLIEDFKTSGETTKEKFAAKVKEYLESAQVPFYMLGAVGVGEGLNTRRFRYCMVTKRKSGVEIQPFETTRTVLQLREFFRSVHQTCQTIEFYKREFGIERPWPQLAERYDRGYGAIMGSRMFADYTPEGFEPKIEHLPTMKGEVDGV